MYVGTRSVLRVYISREFRSKFGEKLGEEGLRYLISYAAEQWLLGNVAPGKNGVSYIEMLQKAKHNGEVIWVAELDQLPRRLVLLDIGPRDRDKRDGFGQYIAEICGRFVGGVIGAMTS